MVYDVTIDGKDYRLELERAEVGWRCRLDGRDIQLDAVLAGRDVLSVLIGGKAYDLKREHTPTDMGVWVGSVRYLAEVRDPRSLRGRRSAGADEKGPKKLLAPMPGKVVRVLLGQGQAVEAGQSILVVEAMKMQNEMKSPKAGRVAEVKTKPDATVAPGEVLVVIE